MNGNLILAVGIKNGYCKLGNITIWYDLSGPFKGSKEADSIEEICEKAYSGYKP